jgi:hypothetical protein
MFKRLEDVRLRMAVSFQLSLNPRILESLNPVLNHSVTTVYTQQLTGDVITFIRRQEDKCR